MVEQLGWNLEYPEIQQKDPGFGDQISQPDLGTQNSEKLSQLKVTDSQKNDMYKRYLSTKPFVRFKADRARLVSARRHVIGSKFFISLISKYILEQVNGSIKKFKFLANTVPLKRVETGETFFARIFKFNIYRFLLGFP